MHLERMIALRLARTKPGGASGLPALLEPISRFVEAVVHHAGDKRVKEILPGRPEMMREPITLCYSAVPSRESPSRKRNSTGRKLNRHRLDAPNRACTPLAATGAVDRDQRGGQEQKQGDSGTSWCHSWLEA